MCVRFYLFKKDLEKKPMNERTTAGPYVNDRFFFLRKAQHAAEVRRLLHMNVHCDCDTRGTHRRWRAFNSWS